MNFQRARNKQAKAERWDEIVNSTLSLFERTSYANITIKDIAQKTSFTRANIYKYISTKEEIFLEIILRDSKKWIAIETCNKIIVIFTEGCSRLKGLLKT